MERIMTLKMAYYERNFEYLERYIRDICTDQIPPELMEIYEIVVIQFDEEFLNYFFKVRNIIQRNIIGEMFLYYCENQNTVACKYLIENQRNIENEFERGALNICNENRDNFFYSFNNQILTCLINQNFFYYFNASETFLEFSCKNDNIKLLRNLLKLYDFNSDHLINCYNIAKKNKSEIVIAYLVNYGFIKLKSKQRFFY
jgi:hypothetical protein